MARKENNRNRWIASERIGQVTLFMSELGHGAPPVYTVLGHYGPEERG